MINNNGFKKMDNECIYNYFNEEFKKINIQVSQLNPIHILTIMKNKKDNLFSYLGQENKISDVPNYFQIDGNVDPKDYKQGVDKTIQQIKTVINNAEQYLENIFMVLLNDFSAIQQNDNTIVLTFSFGIFGNKK